MAAIDSTKAEHQQNNEKLPVVFSPTEDFTTKETLYLPQDLKESEANFDFDGVPMFAPHAEEKEETGEEATTQAPTNIAAKKSPEGKPVSKIKSLSPSKEEVSKADQRKHISEAIRFLTQSAEHYQDISELDKGRGTKILTGIGSVFIQNQKIIDEFLDSNQTLSQQLKEAYQTALDAFIKQASQYEQQSIPETYRQYRNQILPWAIPKPSTDSKSNQPLAALPEASRKKITVIASPVVIPQLPSFFSTKTATLKISLPEKAKLTMSGAIDPKLEQGLKNVAGHLIPEILPLDSTVTLALDLTSFGGTFDAYRFTYSKHPQKGKSEQQEVIIERLGTIGVEGLGKDEADHQQKRFSDLGFEKGYGWSDQEFEALLTAIQLLPDQLLTPVKGLTFNRETKDAENPDVGGDYSPHTHIITLYDKAMESSLTRFGVPGEKQQVQTNTVRSIIHEIGHAKDLLPLRPLMDSLESSQEALMSAFKQFEKPQGSGKFQFPSTEQGRFNRLKAAISKAHKAVKRAQSESGAKWELIDGNWEIVDSPKNKKHPAFRKAAKKDGARFPTDYPNPEFWWLEYYAETFSLFFTSPEVLKQTNPAVFAYFKKKFPEPKTIE